MKRFCLGMLLWWPALLLADGAVWRVGPETGPALYLAGTVHLLRPGDLPLPAAYDRAYRDADALVFETDLGRLISPGTQLLLAQYLRLPEGQRLSRQVSDATWQRLARHLRSRGLAPELFDGLRPGGVVLTLLGVEMTRLGATEEGVDLRLYRRAARDGKPTTGLEPIEKHLGYLLEMGQDDTDLFLQQMLEELEQSESMLEPLIAAWRSGDEGRLERLLVEEMRIDYSPVYERLLADRNALWWPVLERLFRSPDTELVLVGAAHLVGPDGLLAKFREQGVRIERVD